MNFEDSIAHKAHGLVHGDRAKDYGHPRFDFTAIGKVWTGLMQDLLKEDAVIDPYRVAVLMTGLKLCRLVKSPGHHDSRVDTIGYMLTMERLDEPEILMEVQETGEVAREDEDDCGCLAGACTCDYSEDAPVPGLLGGGPQLTFNQVSVWFEAGEEKWINGQSHKNTDSCGKLIVFPFAPGTDVIVTPHPPANPLTGDQTLGVEGLMGREWVQEQALKNSVKEVHGTEVYVTGQSTDKMKWTDKDGHAVKRVHDHEFSAPCMPPCPVWLSERPQFEFTGETVEFRRPDGNE